VNDVRLSERKSLDGGFSPSRDFTGLSEAKDAGGIDIPRGKTRLAFEPHIEERLPAQNNSFRPNGNANANRSRVASSQKLQCVELGGGSVEDRLQDGVRPEFLADHFNIKIRDASLCEAEGNDGLGMLVVVKCERNPAAPIRDLLVA